MLDRLYISLAKTWHRLIRLTRRILGLKKTVYVQERVPFYRAIWREAAAAKSLSFAELSDSIWQIELNDRIVARVNNYIVSLDDPVTLDIAGDKLVTYRLLADAGVSIPRYAAITMDSLDRIRQFLSEVQAPYVVKPARNTSSGIGVTTNLHRLRDCLSAAALAFAYSDEILIEEHIVGESYRLLFLGHDMVCASRRSGLRVLGDGATTLEDLAVSQLTDHLGGRRVGVLLADPEVRRTLAAQGLSADSIPAAERSVLVSASDGSIEGSQEVRTVYTEDVSDVVCDALVAEARSASLALGSEFCGVDVITVDPTQPLSAGVGIINEINTTPGLHHHYNLKGTRQSEPLAETVLTYLMEKHHSHDGASGELRS